MYRVLLLCKDNALFSPMAEGYLKLFVGDKVECYSAGIEAAEIDIRVVDLMLEEGVDLSGKRPTNLLDLKHIDFDYILTFDAVSEAESHHLPSKPVKYHFDLGNLVPENLSDQELTEAYRHLREKIKKSLRGFVKDHFDSLRTK